MHEFAEEVAVFIGEAQHLGNNPDRNVCREVVAGIDVGTRTHLVEEVVAQFADLRFEGVHRPGRKGRQNETTSDLVKGRVRADRRGHANGCRRRIFTRTAVTNHDGTTGEVLSVVSDGRDSFVGGGEPAAAVAVSVSDGATTAKVLPNRIGVCNPLRIRVVPVGGEIANGWLDRH